MLITGLRYFSYVIYIHKRYWRWAMTNSLEVLQPVIHWLWTNWYLLGDNFLTSRSHFTGMTTRPFCKKRTFHLKLDALGKKWGIKQRNVYWTFMLESKFLFVLLICVVSEIWYLLLSLSSRKPFVPPDQWLATSQLDMQSFIEAAMYVSFYLHKNELAYIFTASRNNRYKYPSQKPNLHVPSPNAKLP
jgi:hypothetical protein